MAAYDALTRTQWGLLSMLRQAEQEDVPVHVGTRTLWVPDRASAARSVAVRLVRDGWARWTLPEGRFVLITDVGRALLKSRGIC